MPGIMEPTARMVVNKLHPKDCESSHWRWNGIQCRERQDAIPLDLKGP